MRTTIELSDELFRRAKAVAALRGRKFKDLVEEGLRLVLDGQAGSVKEPAPTLYQLMKDYCGVADSGVDDLGSNPEHMDDFGDASKGDR